MFKRISILLLSIFLLVALAPFPIGATDHLLRQGQIKEPDGATKTRLTEGYGKLPLHFEANQGQVHETVRFLSRGKGYGLFLTSTEAVLTLRKANRTSEKTGAEAVNPQAGILRMKWEGANEDPMIEGVDELEGKSHYFLGNDPDQWRTNIPIYQKVRYRDLYPGIDLIYYGNQRQLEYDLVVTPTGDPGSIRLVIEGAEGVRVDEGGRLILRVGGGEVIQHVPLIYQEVEGEKKFIKGGYVVDPSGKDKGEVLIGFKIDKFDTKKPLVIDPVLVYSTYLGGSGVDYGQGIAVDSSGSAYITGTTSSNSFPTTSPIQGTNAGSNDAFVTKLNPSGSALVYSTYLGGSGVDYGQGIAVDSSGSAYITGDTNSTNFPTANPIQGAYAGGYSDAFVTKLNPSGSALVYSTYLGGSDIDYGRGIAVDSSGSAYITGGTFSTNFPTANPIQGAHAGGYDDAFVTKLNPSGSALVYSTYLGGSKRDFSGGIAVDSSGSAYITGGTDSTDFPTANPFQEYNGSDAFVTKLNPSGSALVYSTYLGGGSPWSHPNDYGSGIAVDSSGSAYITGWTRSDDFPTVNPIQDTCRGCGLDSYSAFVTKLNPSGSTLVYSTYLGGSGHDGGNGIAVDSSGSAYITGGTSSTDFPTANPFQGSYAGGGGLGVFGDAFVTKIFSETVSTPTIPSGPTSGDTGIPYLYQTGSSSSDLGHSVEYQFDWKGDGSDLSPWGSATQSKTWNTPGTYNVRARARCTIDTSEVSCWSGTLSVNITSETVSTPTTLSGPTSGITGTSYIYSTGGSLSNFDHPVEYQFDWKGDGTDLSSWGATTQSKIWTAAGTYNVKARARCAIHTDLISSWSSSLSVTITVPSTVATNPSGLQILVDGSTYTEPHTFDWTPGSSHNLSIPSPQSGTSGTRYIYSSWSDGGTQTHTINAPSSSTTYTASFTTQYSLTTSVNPSWTGTITPSGTNWYVVGQNVFISSTANPGYTFSGWSGDLSGTNNPTSIPMNGPKNVVANFTQNQYTLIVNIAPIGSGLVTKVPDKTTYVYGDVVTLTATANAGYTFSNWSGDATGSTNPVTVTMNGNRTVTANFTPNQYTLTVNIAPSGSGSVTKSPDKASYIYGEWAYLKATAATGYAFDKWTGDVSGATNPIALTVNGNKTVTANFVQIPIPTTRKVVGVDIDSDSLVEINLIDGSLRTIGFLGFGSVSNIAFNPEDNNLYGFDGNLDAFLIIDTGTGVATSIGHIPMGSIYNGLLALVYDPDQKVFLGTVSCLGPGDFYGFKDAFIRINPLTVELTVVGSLSSGRIDALGFDQNGVLWGIQGGTGKLFTIDPVTGFASFQKYIFGANFLTSIAGLLEDDVFLVRDSSGEGLKELNIRSGQCTSIVVPANSYSIVDIALIPCPEISVSPLSKNFGSVNVGGTSSAQTFTVSNTGVENLIIGALSITGTDASEFSKQNDMCSGQTVALSSSCTVDVLFSPTSAGVKNASLSIPSNDPDTPTVNVSLTGATGAGVSTINLPQTGQTKCYDQYGTEINCSGTVQDGEIQAGVEWPNPRFTTIYCSANTPCTDQNSDCDNNASTDLIRDNLTGLVWARNGNLPNSVKNWQGALDYVTSLNAGNGLCGYFDWRLPNINELESLLSFGEANIDDWLISNGFVGVKEDNYWSSTTVNHYPFEEAYEISLFHGGCKLTDYKSNNKMSGPESGYYAWPVRSGQTNNPDYQYPANIWKTGQTQVYFPNDDGDLQMGVSWPNPRFTNLEGTTPVTGDLVVDQLTGLIWTRNVQNPGPSACLPGSGKSYQEALDFVKCLNVNFYLGYNDWRLPNIKELSSLIDSSKIAPALPSNHPFLNASTNSGTISFWSSTTLISRTDFVLSLDSGFGVFCGMPKKGASPPQYVWPVRGGQISGLKGTVNDKTTGSYIPSVTVSTINKNIQTNLKGYYYLRLNPGTYEVTFSKPGYQTLTISNIVITEGQNTELNAELQTSEVVSTPNTPSGPVSGTTGINCTYSTGGSTSSYGHSVEYQFDWKGDGSDLSSWGASTQSKIWTVAGTYNVRARARCATDTSVLSSWSGALSVTISVPETVSTPSILTGPTSGTMGTSYSYTTGGSTSSYGHPVEYQFDWKGDGSDLSSWGSATQSKTWATPGTYNVRARARCTIDTSVVSSWSGTLSVTISVPETVSTPSLLSGPTSGTVGTSYSYTTGGSTSSYDHPVEYQFDWKGNGTDLSPWGAATQSKIWTAAGTYKVKARARCTLDTSVISGWSGSIKVVIALNRSTRTLPHSYTPSLPLTVVIAINPSAATQAYSAEDSPPSGWTVSNINEYGQWDDVNKKVKWGIFFDSNFRTLTYQVTPPIGETAVKSFSGQASFDGVNEVIGGDSMIELGALLHPADTSLNFELSISEVTAYAAAWRSGQTWPVPPNPIPIEYPTNAGYLWRNGEVYHYDATKIPPSCWVPGAATEGLSVKRSLPLKNRASFESQVALNAGAATRDLPNCYTPSEATSISITVAPGQGTQAYAVEDSPPAGWTVSDINENGGWDDVKKKVKWGPFFDSNSRTLTYKVTPPSDETGMKTFSGTASFDGTDVAITGDSTFGGCSTAPITLQSPSDNTHFEACTLYSLPAFSWTAGETFRNYEIQFSPDESFSSTPVKVRVSGTATQITMTSSTWKRVLSIPGGTVYWRIIGKQANRKTAISAISEVYSFITEPSKPVTNQTISPTSITSLPTLSWGNNCNTKFKVWFESDEQFSKKKAFAFNITNPNDNEGEFTKVLTSGQWMAIRRVVGDTAGSTIYWYIESWDGLKRYNKSDVINFVLTD